MLVEIYRTKFQELKKNYILHLILSAVIIIYNFLILIDIYWLKDLLYYIYISISSFGILYLIIPIIPFIYILLKKITHKNIKTFRNLSITFCALVIITGLGFIIILMINALEMTEFCHECPFNLDSDYINLIYENYMNHNYEEKELKKQCKNRRCIYNNDYKGEEYSYEYVCNYDPTEEFDTIKNKTNNVDYIPQIECNKIDINLNINSYNIVKREIEKFLEMCNSLDDFYICQRINQPDYFSLPRDFKCPKKNYMTILIIFCMINVLFNLIISFFPWRAEYNRYKIIINSLAQSNRPRASSLNSTRNASKIKREPEKEESFKKEPTELIFVYSNTDENIMNENEHEHNGEHENEIYTSGKHKANNLNNIKTNNNNIQINNIIINNISKNRNNNMIDTPKDDNHLKVLKLNKNKKKENDKNMNKKITTDNTPNNNRRLSPSSERNFLGDRV
jgi:hypothetical protein